MNDWMKKIFNGPIKIEDPFYLIKSDISIKNFIENFEYKSAIEDQIILVNQLTKILAYKKSIINICIINKYNELKAQNDNSLAIGQKSNNILEKHLKQDKNFVDWLIKEYFLYKNEKITKGILNILVLFMNVAGAQKSSFQFIYQKISDYFFYSSKKYFHEEDKININNDLNNLTRCLNLLLLMYGNNEKLIKPYNFYYFGNDGYLKMEQPLKQMNSFHIRGGITVFCCFNCLYNPKNINKKYSIIFSIEFNKETYFSLLLDGELNLILNISKENVSLINDYEIKNKIILANILNDKWYNVNISLNTKKHKKILIYLIINEVQYDILEIENNDSIEKIENVIMFKGFIGLTTSFLLFNAYFDIFNYNYFNDFQYGFYKISHINKCFSKEVYKNILQNILILIIPFQIKSNNVHNFANHLHTNLVDVLIITNDEINIKFIHSNNNCDFNEEIFLSGSNINSRLNKNIITLGGIGNLLPLFEILLNINKKIFVTKNFIYLNLLQKNIICLLQIIEVIIDKNKNNKIKKIINSKFFKILSLFLEKINPTNDIEATIFNDKAINILKNIGNILIDSNLTNKQKLCKVFFNKILLNANIIKKFNIIQQIKIIKYIYESILNNVFLLIDYKNIIFLIKYFDNIYKINYCCKEHFLFIKGFSGTEAKLNYNKMLNNLLNICTKLLSFIIKNEFDAYIDLLNLLICENSPCLIELMLKNVFIENLNIKNKENRNIKKILKNLLKSNFLYVLLYLLSIYIYPTIIKEIISLLSFISYLINSFGIHLTNFFNNTDIINYLTISIYPIHLKIKGEYISKLNNNIEETNKFNHFFSSDILPILINISNNNESLNYSIHNINKCNTYDRFQIKNFKLDNNSQKLLKINNSNNKYERKRNISNSIKYPDNIKLNKSLSHNKIKKNFKNDINVSFEKESKNNERLSLKINHKKTSNYNNYRPIIDEENKDMILLNQLDYDRKLIYKRLIFNSLINWLNMNPSKFIFEIIIKYIKNINYDYINIDKFIDTFNQMLKNCTKEEECNLNDLIDVKTFIWFFEIIFQFYLLKYKLYEYSLIPYEEEKNDLINNIIINGKNLIINVLLNNINSNKYNFLIEEINYIMFFSKEIKKKYGKEIQLINVLNDYYKKLFLDLLNICQHILVILIKANEESHSDSGFYVDDEKESLLIYIINNAYELIFFNNIENNYININNYLKSQNNNIFNNILLSDINIISNFEENNNINEEDNFSIKKYWSDYSIFEKIIEIIKPFISLNNFLYYEDDKFLSENILNPKKSNSYFNVLNILFRDSFSQAEISIDMISYGNILSNINIFSLNLSKNKKEVISILDDYKSYIIFLVLSSSNLYDFEEDTEIKEIINKINNKIKLIINYYIYYIYDKYKTNYEIIEEYLIYVFILMIRIMNIIHNQNRKNNSIFSKISNDLIKENKIINKCVVQELFTSESMIKIFTKEYISLLTKSKFKDNNINNFLEIFSKICKDSNLRLELKNIFKIDTIISKYLDKKELKIFIDFSLEENINQKKMKDKILEKIKSLIKILNEVNNDYSEKNYIKKLKYQNHYKNVKKNLFGFNGFWRNVKLFASNGNNDETIKYKLINHYSNSLVKNILWPIFDLDNYLSQLQFINKNTIFKQNKNMNNINIYRKSITNLDFKKIFININNISQPKNNDNNIQYQLIEEIRNKIFPELNFYINTISNNNIFEFNNSNPSKKSFLLKNSYSCCYVKPDTHVKGYLLMNEKKIKFVMNIYNNNDFVKLDEDEFDMERGCCYGCIIKYKNSSKFTTFNIKYSSIKLIFLRRYYYKDSSLEIFTRKNKSYYINFHNPKIRKYIIDMILIHFHSIQEIKIEDDKVIGYYLNNDNNDFFINVDELYRHNTYSFDDITKKWKYWEISTFEFLILLNIFSNRSFNDIKQYPVFPWILTQYNDFITSLDRNEKEIKNENSNNDTETKAKKPDEGLINQLEAHLQSLLNISSLKSSMENNSKNDDLVIEKEGTSNVKNVNIKKDIRDFSVPMGMLSLTELGEKRKKQYLYKYNLKIKYNNNIMENEMFIYSTHYSNAKYISGYLARIFPFIYINRELNGKIFNNEELLISIDKCFKNASSKMDNLNELTPEFFCFPEIFININYFDLKIGDNRENEIKNEKLINNNSLKEKNEHLRNSNLKDVLKEKRSKRKKEIEKNYKNKQNQNDFLMDIKENNNYIFDSNDVLMPKWAEYNPYIFVSKMKIFLESEEVSKSINLWFDLIFGYKQKGKNAINAKNSFPPWTYDSFDIRNIKNDKNEKDRKLYYKLVDKGLTPHQLLNVPFPKRLSKIEDDFSLSFLKNKLKYNSFKNKKKIFSFIKRKVIKMKFIDNEIVFCVFNLFQYAIFDLINFALIVDIKLDYNYKYYLTKEMISKYNYLLIRDLEIFSLNSPIIIYSQGRYIAQGGFYGGLILLSELEPDINDKSKNYFSSILNNTEIFNKIDYSPITTLIINKSEEAIIAGTYMGTVIIYDNSWNIKNVLNDHQHLPITSLNFSDELLIWGSCSMDGYVKIYTYPTNKPILSIKVEQSSYAEYLLISSSPLPSFVIYSKNNLYFYCYSLIGKLIRKEKEEYIEIKTPIIFKDIYGNDKLIYGDDTGSLNIRTLPNLELLIPFEINETVINIIEMSNNRKYCSGWSDEDEEIYIVFDPNLIE